MLLLVIVRSTDDDTEYTVTAAEVEQTENLHYRQLASAAAMNRFAGGQPVPEIL